MTISIKNKNYQRYFEYFEYFASFSPIALIQMGIC